MPLHLSHRPQTLDEVFGNDLLKASLRSIFDREDKPRAFLLYGPSGCGKTTIARIIAREIGCGDWDYHERNIADARGIDDARRLIEDMAYLPLRGKKKVYCLDECQGATPAFQDALLKALEDTPNHVTFILCTTDPQKLKPTIRNRCSSFEVERLPGPVMTELLEKVLIKEFALAGNLYQEFPGVDKVIQAIVEAAEGCPRRALTILDQVIDLPDLEQMLQVIKRDQESVGDFKLLMDCLLKRKPWSLTAKVINDFGEDQDWERLRQGVLSYATKVLLSEGREQAAKIIHYFSYPYNYTGRAGFVLACFRAVS